MSVKLLERRVKGLESNYMMLGSYSYNTELWLGGQEAGNPHYKMRIVLETLCLVSPAISSPGGNS